MTSRAPRSLGLGLALLSTAPPFLSAQQRATITEERRTLATYPFSEPDPVPLLGKDARLYPYHAFTGYAHEPVDREWTVVHLENEWIEVWVLPEVGGKVWGARVKATGHEFIYRNEVMKFRNIALRGPWTSGGIEFNFGVIGHTPATATPVDYLLRENDDGSVSCFVGAMDLPSRTHWRVEIRLPADRAYFETRALWYNPTPLEHPYYNWMTGAAFARDDLELVVPGDTYLTHPGVARAWPYDEEGRYLPAYRNNTFEGNKSYHVVGELNDFFGGYYGSDDWGFGHWARHEDLPGQKIWLWASSRAGGIWEDLLTDTDGQYVEFQAGRLLVQYSPDGSPTPITQAGFEPGSQSRWEETWFPVEGLGGLTDASREAAMSVSRGEGRLTVAVHAFGAANDTLVVIADGREVHREPVALRPLEVHRAEIAVAEDAEIVVRVRGLDLDWASDPSGRRLERPLRTQVQAGELPEVRRLAFQAREHVKAREYAVARGLFEQALQRESWDREALLGLADLEYRSGRPEAALGHANRALQLDAYDAQANFQAGLAYRALQRSTDARDAFGWAARSTAFRAAAYGELAALMIERGDFAEAERYARLALDYDRHNVTALRELLILGRLTSDAEVAEEAAQALLALDPMHHFVGTELFLREDSEQARMRLTRMSRAEYPDQVLLEAALEYARLGRPGDAAQVLAAVEDRGPLFSAWSAWLHGDPTRLSVELAPDDGASLTPAQALGGGDPLAFVFPYRRESLEPLQWARSHSDAWAWTWLTALNLWARDRGEEAADLLVELGDRPDHAPFYVTRARLLLEVNDSDPAADLARAVALDPGRRTLRLEEIRHLQTSGRWSSALERSTAALQRFPDDFDTGLLHARSLVEMGRATEAVAVLETVRVLPSEHARGSHELWEIAQASSAVALAAAGDERNAERAARAALEWPEHLGVGKPYDPDERLARFVLARVLEARGESRGARRELEAVAGSGAVGDARLEALVAAARAESGPSGDGTAASGGPGGALPPSWLDSFAAAWAAGQRDRALALLTAVPDFGGDALGRLVLEALAAGG